MKLQHRVVLAATVEVAYVLVTRTWLRHQDLDALELELAITAARLLTIPVYALLFGPLILSRPRNPAVLRRPAVLAGLAAALAIPFVFRGWSPGTDPGTVLAFVLASFVVGLREELLYRAILLNLLEPRIGAAGALGLSTALFVAYHYGALPFTWLTLTEMTCLSLVLGLLYLRSGSLLAVVLVHSLYDAIWFFGPFLDAPPADTWRPLFLVGALVLVALGTRTRARS